MRYGVGIDFGTTNSAAAVFDGERLRLVALEEHGDIMPSATYIDRDMQTLTGQRAIERYIEDNIGRTVELIPEVIAETSAFVEHGESDSLAPVETTTQKIYGAAVIDSGLQGRLFRGTKRLLGDSSVRRLMVFDQPFRLVALITPILLHIRRCLNEAIGDGRRGTSRPSGDLRRAGDLPQQDRVDAPRRGLQVCRYQRAAFLRRTGGRRRQLSACQSGVVGEVLFTLDFGGGTLDFCVLRRVRQHFDVITTHGIALGGDHIDQQTVPRTAVPGPG